MTRKRIEVLVLVLAGFVAVGDGILIITRNRETIGSEMSGGYVILIGLLLAIMSVVYLLQRDAQETRRELDQGDGQGLRWVIIAFTALAGYVFLIDLAGFMISTGLFFAFYLRVFGAYRWVPIIVASLVVAVGSTYFWSALGMMLPEGFLPLP